MPEIMLGILVLLVLILVIRRLARRPIWPTLAEIRRDRELQYWASGFGEIAGWIKTGFAVVLICLATLLVIYGLVQFVHWAWYN